MHGDEPRIPEFEGSRASNQCLEPRGHRYAADVFAPPPALLAPTYRETALWREGLDARPLAGTVPSRADVLPAHADVVVVGSGYAGMVAAWELARRGREVVVCEANEIGFGGSTRNGGMVIPELKHDLAYLAHRYGSLARSLVDAAHEACALVEELISTTPIDCAYEKSGGLLLAHHPRVVEALEVAARELNEEIGSVARFVPRDALADEIGTTAYHAGLLVESVASIQPARYHAGLVAAAIDAGAVLSDHNRVLRIDRRGQRFRLCSERGDIDAGDVLVVTNAYADGLLPALRRRVVPVGSFMIATEPLDPAVAHSVSPRGRMFYDTKNFLHYWRLSPDGRVAFGGRTSLAPTSVERARDHLYDAMVRVHPQLRGTRIEYAWGGNVAITFDRLPHAGRLDGVAFATGCNGTGIALATWFGRCMAEWMVGAGDAPVFAALPFPKIPLHRLRTISLPLAGTWFRLRDELGY